MHKRFRNPQASIAHPNHPHSLPLLQGLSIQHSTLILIAFRPYKPACRAVLSRPPLLMTFSKKESRNSPHWFAQWHPQTLPQILPQKFPRKFPHSTYFGRLKKAALFQALSYYKKQLIVTFVLACSESKEEERSLEVCHTHGCLSGFPELNDRN